MNNDIVPEEFDYDDGVVSFGTLTENQIERFKRLPRHTVLPSDIQLSQSFLDTDRDEHDASNDCTTQLTNNLAKEKETGTIELKQSSVDESSSFSSPSAVKFFPSTKLLDTDVVNRYMHKKSISSNESLSEYQNTTTIEDESLNYLNDQGSVVTLTNSAHESLNYLDDQESGVTLVNSNHNETEDCEQLSVLNEIDQRQIQKKIPDNANNICTLKPCSLNGEDEEEDISICNETELVNTSGSSEDSIIVEKYSVTPGKQRLYDVRHTKPAFHTKILGTAAPFMDRIEETVTSDPSLHNTLVLSTSPNINVMEININDEPYANELSTNNDTINLNKSLNDITYQISEVINATEHNFGTKESMNNVSEMSVKIDLSDYHGDKSIAVDLEITSTNISVMDTKFDDKLSTNNDGMNLNKSLNETTNQIEEITDATEYNFDTRESMNNVSEMSEKITDLSDYHDDESIAVDVEIASINTSVMDTNFDDELSINKLSTNNDDMNLNKSLNDITYQISEVINATEHNFDTKESMNNVSEMSVKIDLSDYHGDESIAVDLEITTTNISVMDTKFDDKLSRNNDGMNLNKSLNETTNQIEEIMNATEYNFDTNESMNNVSKISVRTTDSTDNINEETMPTTLETTSTNTSVMDTKFDNELCINKFSTNNDGMNLNKSLNETANQIKEIMDATEYSFDTNEETMPVNLEIASINTSVMDTNFVDELSINKLSTNNDGMNLNKLLNETANQIEEIMNATEYNFNTNESMNNVSKISVRTTDSTDNINEETMPATLETTSTNTSVMDTKFDNELCINKFSTNNDGMNLNKSLNETANQIKEIMDATEYSFDTNEETMPVNLEIASINTSVMDTNFVDELSINKLSTNNDGMNLNKLLNETANQIEEIMNATEYNFDTNESMNNVSKISVRTTDSTDNINEETMPATLETTSTNTSVMDTKFDNELCINKLSTNNDGMNLNETANQIEEIMDDTEYNFDTNESMNNVSKISVRTTDSTDNINEETMPVNLEIASINTSVIDTNFVDELSINKLSTNNDGMNLNKSSNETANQIEEIMNATEYNFDTNESMNNVSKISVRKTDSTDNIHEETMPANLETTSTNTSVMDTKFYDKLCTNKLSSNDNGLICIELYNTEDHLKATEFNIDTDKSLNNIHNINVNETSQSCELNNSALKNLINIDISYAEEKDPIHSCEISVLNNGAPQNSSRAMRQFLDFEQTLYEMCNSKLNDSTINDNQTHRNILLTEQTTETYVSDSFSTSANPLESNLSIIIENRTLEENSSDLVMQNEELENPINAVLENIVNENLDNIVLNESATLNNKECLVAKDTLLPEVLKLPIVNEMENNTSERVMKSNDDIFINDSNIDSIFVDNKVISSDEKINEIKCNEICSISSNKFLKAESNALLNKDIQSLELLGETRNINNCLNEFMNMEQMFNFGENQNVQMLNLDTPKTQKILDFSIVPQTPTVEIHAKKQKLLNFSIVDQSPISKDTQQKFLNNSFTENNLSGINKILELESDSFDKDCQNCIDNSSSKNISTISAPDTESFIDVSINSDNSIINQTLTETNLNNTTHSIPQVVKSVTNCASNITFNQNSKKLDCSTILMDLNEKIITKSNKNAIVDFSIEQPIPHTFEINNDANITFVESKTNVANLIDSSIVSMTDVKSNGHVLDSSQIPIIVVSSDIETEKSLTSTLDYCSVNNSTTHLEQSTFSHNSELLTDVRMNDLSLSIESEKSSVNESFHSIELDHVKEDKKRKLEPIQDYQNFEKIMKVEAKDPELNHVQDDSKKKIEPVQVNCNSEKKMKVESKGTESDHVQEDNKRKIKPVHDFHNSEKKMKMESEEPKTPISMLYKIKNMFTSNEKLPQYKSITKSENRFNFNKVKDDKPEVLVKSKIPYKVTNTPRAQNDEFNNSKSLNDKFNNSKSLNDNKSKKGIPKFVGLPALSDLSNKAFPGQNSKFH